MYKVYLNHTHAHILMRACPCTKEDADAAAYTTE